jgi:hypothetical protein
MNKIISGPILRRLDSQQLVLWWVSHEVSQGYFACFSNDKQLIKQPLNSDSITHYRIGERCVIHLLDIEHKLPLDQVIEYDLVMQTELGEQTPLASQIDTLCYPDQQRCSFLIESKLNNLLHGSCRNPHHPSDDSLIAGDNKLKTTLHDTHKRPSILMMSGDQIYADHVAGPMLFAIHKVIKTLGLYEEVLPDNALHGAVDIFGESPNYYERKALLPLTETTKYWRKNQLTTIFTSDYVHNHLITLAEVNAMYLLVWSPSLWEDINLNDMPRNEQHSNLQQTELQTIEAFVQGLPQVQRLLAHISCYMIFDDHDVTDDWNLTAKWEETAYNNPLAKRILGNALFGYWLFQGWGNQPTQFDTEFLVQANDYQLSPQTQQQDNFIERLLSFNRWHYHVDSQPKMLVLDCRTQRWRSENNLNSPSGLMDWESLCLLQQQLIGESAVIMVSPAPIFGVKLIESIQRLATVLGQSLAVDAENWMAHPGSANTILNVFRHSQTPQHFVILSGDVHYSFVYDIELRFHKSSPKIWQITSSGIKNQFPSTLINILDKANRFLYSVYSPLNLFTKRRDMIVRQRKVIGNEQRRLIERSGLGYLELNDDGSPQRIYDLHNNGEITEFINSKEP